MNNLPSSEVYELSYMHRDNLNHIITSSKTDFIVTCSVDGHIKFWKKVFQLVEFVKNFKAHSGLVSGVALNREH